MIATIRVVVGDVMEQIQGLPDESVHSCVTSPPYWGLRDYGVEGQLGLEKTPEEYIEKMVGVFREVRRVLRKDGTAWVNMGDAYAANGCSGLSIKGESSTLGGSANSAHTSQHKTVPSGLKPKDLCGIPWRLAFALQADGWYLRSDIIWHKPNPMPESVTDRPTKSHEYIFLLAKSQTYFYDAEAIREAQCDSSFDRAKYDRKKDKTNKGLPTGSNRTDGGMIFSSGINALPYTLNPNDRNKRSVWTVPSHPYSEAHFATFPPDLIKPCILAGTSARGCCAKCGAPWERVVEAQGAYAAALKKKTWSSGGLINGNAKPAGYDRLSKDTVTTGWRPTCQCNAEVIPCTVLDPFGGSGTTGMVALEMGRNAILIELNPEYVKLIKRRCDVTPGFQF